MLYNLYRSYESPLVNISEVNSAEISSVNLPRCIKCNTNVSESPQEHREILTSLPNNFFRLLHYILLHLIIATVCSDNTESRVHCFTSCCCVKFVASRETTVLRQIRHISELLCSKDNLRRIADGLRHSPHV